MTEEITLDTINEKLDIIIGTLNAHTTALSNITETINGLTIPKTEPEIAENETVNQFKTELQTKIDQGLPYDEVKQWIIETIATEGIYSPSNIIIKLFTDVKGNIILEVKTRPYTYLGYLLQFLQDSMGDADKFETSRYTMNIIMWWELTKNQQMEDMESTTDIVDDVNEQWGNNDDINLGK